MDEKTDEKDEKTSKAHQADQVDNTGKARNSGQTGNTANVGDSGKAGRAGQSLGITVKKEQDFSEWYTQLIIKSELADYSPVSGCMIIRPRAYAIWESIQKFFNSEIKKLGVQNCYFPSLIPESLLSKESSHVQGFKPEVAWVTEGGDTKLSEKLAIRPTSETIMYDAYSKWIRSHKDLPIRLNQWCNVVRWEFKHPVPFLRTREFLWQEGHSAFATRQDAEHEVFQILDIYARIFEELLAIPVIKGKKSEAEKFAGALFSTSVETFLPSGRAIQGATSHCLGQNFAKAFDITFLDEKGEKQYVWQNSWGISTRTIGIMAMMHSDDNGLIIPPKVAPIEAVIVPIFSGDSKETVMNQCHEVKRLIKGYKAFVDERDYTPGWKFNDAELKGIPIRIEIGPKDVEKQQAVIVRRDTKEKLFVKLEELNGELQKALDSIQSNLYHKAKKFIDSSVQEAYSIEELNKIIESKKIAKIAWCATPQCEEDIKARCNGAKSMSTPLDAEKPESSCVVCNQDAKSMTYFAKSY